MGISRAGLDFIARHEGCILRGYYDPVGIPTFGIGFTERDPTVRAWLEAKGVARITPELRITRADALALLERVIDGTYAPAAAEGMPGAAQHQFDMGVSGAFNCGPRIFKWKWAKAFRAGDVKGAAERWRATATTAKGRRLPGLVRRRKEEAALLERGDYGRGSRPRFEPATRASRAKPDETLRAYQKRLAQLGYTEVGKADGLRGPKTTAAVKRFQREHDLTQDGILGRATMETIDRVLTERQTRNEGAGGVAGLLGLVLTWLADLPPWLAYAAGGVTLAVVLYMLWKYRARVEHALLKRL